MECVSAIDSVAYHAQVMKKSSNIPDKVPLLPDFKLRFLKCTSLCAEGRL